VLGVEDALIAALRVFVVGDHDVVREGITALLVEERDLEVVADAGYTHDLVARIIDASPAVVVIDHSPPRGDGLRLCRRLREAAVQAKIVLLVDPLNVPPADEALSAGVATYVPKEARSDALAAAVRASTDPSDAAEATPRVGGVPLMGRSQLAVLKLLVDGLSVAEIAEAMGLSPHTVRSYLRQIYRRLGVSSRAEAAAVALRMGLL
jgi:DNA-binding NarL/FixJ family response regulator